ncbi:MAG: ABC transporter permease, partial [Candidatus Binatia bacterium]
MATRYIAGRVLAIVPVLFIVSIVVSLMVHLTPGDPVQVMMGQSGASAEEIEQVRIQLGLDKPLPVQYVRFLQDLATGELRSIRTHQPVVQQYLELFPYTLQLAVVSLLVATVIGMLLGVVAATHQNSWLDSFSMAVGFLGVSIPNFWLALVLIYVFAVSLNWLPATGADGPK